MRSSKYPFKISNLVILFTLLISSQSIFAQSGWFNTFSNPAYNFYSIQFIDSQNGIALADSLHFPYNSYTNIFRTTDGGSSWNRVINYNGRVLNGLFRGPDSTIFAFGSFDGAILRSTDIGLTWAYVNYSFSDFRIRHAQFINSNTGFAYGNDSLFFPWIWKTTNKGLNWSRIGEPNCRPTQIFMQGQFIDENIGWAFSVGQYQFPNNYVSKLEKTTNGGASWQDVFNFISQNYNSHYFAFNFFDSNTGWLVSPSNIKKTTNGGLNWFDYQPWNLGNLVFYMVNENTGWGGDATKIYKTTNSGVNWFLQYMGAFNDLRSFGYADSNNAWFCGNAGKIFKTTNGGGMISGISSLGNEIPEKFSLSQNYPNPFNPTTKINFDLKNSAFAMLRVYDINGREVRTLVSERLSPGSYSYDFNASELPSGVYYYQLQTGGFIETKKMMLLK